MTLNIALASRHAVYLSGDFQLEYPQPQRRRLVSDFDTQKLIPVVKYRWCGLVAFCGVAKLPDGQHVGDWIASRVHPDDMKCSVTDLIGRLLAAESWLPRVNGDRSFCMVLAGFEERRPFVRVISNCQGLGKRKFSPLLEKLRVELFRPRAGEIELEYFGNRTAPRGLDVSHLKATLRREPHRNLMPEIASLNEHAAMVSGDTISKECVVGYALPIGEVQIAPFVDRRPGYMPGFVHASLRRMGVKELIPRIGLDGQPLQPTWVGATFKNGSDNGTDSMVGMMRIANVEQAVGDAPPPGMAVGWKIADENEPSAVTVDFPAEPPNESNGQRGLPAASTRITVPKG